MKTFWRWVGVALLAGGCTAGSEGTQEMEATAPAGLHVQVEESSVQGTFLRGDETVAFGLETLAEEQFDLFVELHGMRLTLLADAATGVLEFDGYTAADASNTQMTEADRELLLGLARALDSLGEGDAVPRHVSVMRRMVDHWAEHSDTRALQWQKVYEAARGVTSLCANEGYFVKFTHDCDRGADGSDITTMYGLAAHTDPCAGCAESSKFKTCNTTGCAYQCLASEPNHSDTLEYGKGNCWGRCGAGCGSEKDYTKDCGDHDLCVRSGHAISSIYCNDEATDSVDDEMDAPNCGFTPRSC